MVRFVSDLGLLAFLLNSSPSQCATTQCDILRSCMPKSINLNGSYINTCIQKIIDPFVTSGASRYHVIVVSSVPQHVIFKFNVVPFSVFISNLFGMFYNAKLMVLPPPPPMSPKCAVCSCYTLGFTILATLDTVLGHLVILE